MPQPETSAQVAKRISQPVLDGIVRKHLSESKFKDKPEMADTFFKGLEKNGYSKDQVMQSRVANSDIVPLHATFKDVSHEEKSPIGTSLVNSSKGIANGIEQTFKAGADIMAPDATKEAGKSLTTKLGDLGTDVLNIGAGVLKTGFGALGLLNPGMAAFNAATETVNELPVSVKAGIHDIIVPTEGLTEKQKAENFDKTVNFPFSAASTIAHEMGYDPKDGSALKAALEITNILVPLGIHKAGEAYKDMTANEFTDIANNLGEGTATPDQIKAYGAVIDGMKEASIGDIKDGLNEKAKIDKKNNYLSIPNEEILKAIHQDGETPQSLRGKANAVDAKVENENPKYIDEVARESDDIERDIKDEPKREQLKDKLKLLHSDPLAYFEGRLNEINEYAKTEPGEWDQMSQHLQDIVNKIKEQQQKQSDLTQQSQAHTAMADAIEHHEEVSLNPKEHIDENNANTELTDEEKQVYNDKVTDSTVKDNAIKEVEQAKVNHITDLQALSDPKSKEFYSLVENAIADKTILPRVKQSIDAAVKAGELTQEEGDAQYKAFEERLPIQEKINPKITYHEDRMEAVRLQEKLMTQEARLKEMKGYHPPMPESSINAKIKAIEETKQQQVDLLDKANEKAKAEKEKLESQNPPVEPPVDQQNNDGESPEVKKHAIWKRVLGGIKDKELAAGLEKEGVTYLTKKQVLTESAAQEVINAAKEAGTLADLEKIILDDSNGMDPTTRGVAAALLGKEYFDKYNLETDPEIKSQHRREFVKYTKKAAAMATEGGQTGNAIGKVVKKMYANDPETIIEMVRDHFDSANEKATSSEEAKNTYQSIKDVLDSPEGQDMINEKVKAGVEEEVDKLHKKLTVSQKLKADKAIAAIEKFQKKLRLNSYSSVPVAILDTGITTVKLAIKAGTTIADAVELGIDKIKELHKDVWEKEGAFRKDMLDNFEAEGVEGTRNKKSITAKQEASILDTIEKKAGKLNEKNKQKFLRDVIQEVEKEGGLDEQRFKDLYAEALGLQTMTPELTETIKGYAKIINEGTKASKDYEKALNDLLAAEKDENTTPEQLKALQQAKANASNSIVTAALRAKQANAALSNIMKDGKNLADTFVGMMQLGALTPGSLIKNITAMPAELMFRGLAGHTQGAVDYLLTGLANAGLAPESWKERTVNPWARAQGAAYAHPKALRHLYDTLIHGSFEEDYTSREVAHKIEPVQAFKNLVEGKTKGDLSATVANIMEALPQGWIASGMGRMLAGPDAFFRTVGEQAKAYELATMKGLEGTELEKYMLDPHPEDVEKIKKAGDMITFQQDSKVSEFIKGGFSKAKAFSDKTQGVDRTMLSKAFTGAMRVLGKSQALYVKTPINVLSSVVRMISPEYSILRAAAELSKGNKEGFSKYAADAAVGYVLRHVIVNAIKHNMVTPTVDYKSKEGSAQSDEGVKHGGKFNISAFNRTLQLGDWQEQPTDTWVDYSKWTGGLGIAMGAYASMLDGTPKDEMDQLTMVKNSYKILPTMMQQVMDLSFMSQSAMAIDAMRENGTDSKIKKWTVGTVGTIATPLFPNTVTTAIKATSDTKKSVWSKNLLDNIVNDFDYKLTGGSDLPSKVTLWGERVNTAPAGANKYIYNLLDVRKTEDPDENSLGYKIVELYKSTKNPKILPTPPSNQITLKKNVKVDLTGDQQERLQIIVGQLRKKAATVYLNEANYKSDDDDTKAYKLEKIYSEAAKEGKEMLIKSDEALSKLKDNKSRKSSSGRH